jgi:hypothetical protein
MRGSNRSLHCTDRLWTQVEQILCPGSRENNPNIERFQLTTQRPAAICAAPLKKNAVKIDNNINKLEGMR